jgi:hypothetical protein
MINAEKTSMASAFSEEQVRIVSNAHIEERYSYGLPFESIELECCDDLDDGSWTLNSGRTRFLRA